jgi:hypothetical protein
MAKGTLSTSIYKKHCLIINLLLPPQSSMKKKSSTLSKNKQFKTSLRTTQNTSFMEFVKLKYDEWPEYVNVLVSFDILKSDNHRRR